MTACSRERNTSRSAGAALVAGSALEGVLLTIAPRLAPPLPLAMVRAAAAVGMAWFSHATASGEATSSQASGHRLRRKTPEQAAAHILTVAGAC
jgi:hypothetical protein